MSAPRLVLDTNVLVSALIFGRGRLSWLRHAIAAKRVVPLASAATAQEFMDVLAYSKFGFTETDRNALMQEYLPYCEAVAIPRPPPRVPPCRDPADAMFLHLALSGKADALVTGDADLLILAGVFPVPILQPAEMKKLISASD